MKEQGYGNGYLYAHDFVEGITSLECLPEALRGREYYRPGQRGWEHQADVRLNDLRRKLNKTLGNE
jgi:putative ATPase